MFSYIRDASKRDKQITLILAFLFYITFETVFRSYLSMTFLFSLFLSMIIMEDYRNSEIDMLNVLIFAVLGCFISRDAAEYMMGIVISFVIFYSIMYLSAKKVDNNEEGNILQEAALSQKDYESFRGLELPYIPSLAIAVFVFSWYIEIFNPGVPYCLYDMDFLFGIISEEITYCGFLLAAVTVLGLSRLAVIYKKKKYGEIAYGMGDGDPFVLAVMASLFGARHFFIIFFISMIAVLVAGGSGIFINYLRGRKCDKQT